MKTEPPRFPSTSGDDSPARGAWVRFTAEVDHRKPAISQDFFQADTSIVLIKGDRRRVLLGR